MTTTETELRAKIKRLQARTKRLGNERDEAVAKLLALEAKIAAGARCFLPGCAK